MPCDQFQHCNGHDLLLVASLLAHLLLGGPPPPTPPSICRLRLQMGDTPYRAHNTTCETALTVPCRLRMECERCPEIMYIRDHVLYATRSATVIQRVRRNALIRISCQIQCVFPHIRPNGRALNRLLSSSDRCNISARLKVRVIVSANLSRSAGAAKGLHIRSVPCWYVACGPCIQSSAWHLQHRMLHGHQPLHSRTKLLYMVTV